MLNREIRDFVQATIGIQKSGPAFTAMDRAKQEAARLLGVDIPSEAEFNLALLGPVVRRKRGRRHSESLSSRDAVAAVAVYFESLGAGSEQAIIEAKRWLNLPLSRRVAKVAVSAFKANTSPEQFKQQALWAYSTFKPGTTLPLPESMTYARKKRRAKSDLG